MEGVILLIQYDVSKMAFAYVDALYCTLYLDLAFRRFPFFWANTPGRRWRSIYAQIRHSSVGGENGKGASCRDSAAIVYSYSAFTSTIFKTELYIHIGSKHQVKNEIWTGDAKPISHPHRRRSRKPLKKWSFMQGVIEPAGEFHTHMHTCSHMHTQTQAHTYTHTHTHTHKHTHTHTQARARTGSRTHFCLWLLPDYLVDTRQRATKRSLAIVSTC